MKKLVAGLLLFVVVIAYASAQVRHLASCDVKCQEEHRAMYAAFQQNIYFNANVEWFLNNVDRDSYHTALRNDQLRDFNNTVEMDIKKISDASRYPLITYKFAKYVYGVDAKYFLVEGVVCSTNKYPGYGFPVYCGTFINGMEWNPTFKKLQQVDDRSNYYILALPTGYYCRSVPPFPAVPDPNPLPKYYEPYHGSLTVMQDGAYYNASDVPVNAAHVTQKQASELDELFDSVFEYSLIQSEKDREKTARRTFDKNFKLYLPENPYPFNGTEGEQKLYEFFHNDCMNISYTSRHNFYVRDNKLIAEVLFSLTRGEGHALPPKNIVALGFISVESDAKRKDVTVVRVAIDDNQRASFCGYCSSDDVALGVMNRGMFLRTNRAYNTGPQNSTLLHDAWKHMLEVYDDWKQPVSARTLEHRRQLQVVEEKKPITVRSPTGVEMTYKDFEFAYI